jgi:hypothetical protein
MTFYRFTWWMIGIHFCDLGSRLFGDRWHQLYGCRVHGGVVAPDVPQWMWDVYGWNDETSK